MLYSLPMKAISSLLPYIQIVLAIILVAAILLQQTGAAMGGAFGGSDNFSSAFHTRRGFEKTLFIITIAVAILFAVSALLNLVK
ncbi:MAG: preprotein translocase subunit SecG [bacterium]